MANPLLSTYRSGENRVTSSTVAVFERIDLALVQEILEAATEAGGELTTVTFENQVVEETSVPDARISARFTWWFETKTARNGYASEGHDRDQLRSHAKQLETDLDAYLFVLTPDAVRPAWFSQLDGIDQTSHDRVLWLSFRGVADAIDRVITDPARLVSEQTKFLLTELVALFESDGLLANDDTVIVAARVAWPKYQELNAYICQPDRSFKGGLTYLGFYADGEIKPVVPCILKRHSSVLFTPAEVEQRRAKSENDLADLIEGCLADPSAGYTEGDAFGVFLLSSPTDQRTRQLPAPIVNDVTATSGRPWAWTLGQRYTSVEKLETAVKTSDL